jgi:hypothetical protein
MLANQRLQRREGSGGVRLSGPRIGQWRFYPRRHIEQTRDAHEQAENVLIRMRPERWLTVDYAKAYGSL